MKNTLQTTHVPATLKACERKTCVLHFVIIAFLLLLLPAVSYAQNCIRNNTISKKPPVCDNTKGYLEGSQAYNADGSPVIAYQWQINTHSSSPDGFVDIIGATGEDYSIPGTDDDKSWYRRVAIYEECRVVSKAESIPNGSFQQIVLPTTKVVQPTCNDPTGSITILVPETAVRFSIDGVNFSSTREFKNLTPGTYLIVAEYSGGCFSPAVEVVINPPPASPIGNISPSNALICPNGSQLLTATGGTSYQWQLNGIAISGATAATYTATRAGEYSVIVTNDGCSALASNTAAVSVASGPVFKVTNPEAGCSAVDLTVPEITAGSDAGLSFTYWTNQAATTPLINPNAVAKSGIYYIKATNSAGCSIVLPVNVTISQSPNGSISPASVSLCAGESATLTTTGGTSYQWSKDGVLIPGATQATYKATSNGTYSVTIFNDGCSTPASNQVVVNQIDPPNGSITPATGQICQNGSLTLITSGGDKYQWMLNGSPITDATSATYTATKPGIYSVSIYKASCNAPASNSAEITLSNTPIGSITPEAPTICAGGKVTLNAPAGFASYQWFRNGSAISDATKATYIATQAGAYNVDFTTTEGCTGKASTTVTLTSTPTGAITPANASLCPGGGAVLLTASGGTSYQWYRDGVPINGAISATYNASQIGTYSTDIINGACKGTSSNKTIITEATTPTGSISPAEASLCNGAIVALTVTGGNSYQWYKDGQAITGATSATYSVTVAGTYSADIINGTCKAPATNNVVVTQSSAPAGAIVPATVSICSGGEAVLTVSGGVSYQWYRNGQLIAGATAAAYTANQAGMYTADIFSAGGCKGSASNQSIVNVSTVPTGSISPNQLIICNGGSGILTATGGTSYQWYRDGAAISGATNATLNVTQPGVYNADIINGDCKGKANNTVNVTLGSSLIGTITPSTGTLCSGGFIELTATGGNTYQWYKDGELIAGATSNTFKATTPGTYTADLIDGTCEGQASNKAVISSGTSPNGSISPATAFLCGSESTVTLNVTGGVAYQWYRDGIAISGATRASYNATQSGVYTAEIINGDCKGKSANSATVSHSTAPSGSITPSEGSLCNGAPISLKANGGATYQWYRNGMVITGATSATYTATEAGTYTVDIIGAEGCKSRAGNSAIITAGAAPVGEISPAEVILCSGGSATLTATGGSSYQWYMDGVVIQGATQNTYTIKYAGTYTADIINGDCRGKASNKVVAIIGTLPTGTISPASVNLCAGGSASLTVSGGASYQWYKDGVLIPGATNAILEVRETGTYTADIISGSCKGKASNSSIVNLATAPTGSIIPASLTICTGGSGELTATGGTSYQWYRNGTIIAGATAAVYKVTQAGTYSIDIINGSCKGKAANNTVVTIGVQLTGAITPATGVLCGDSSLILTATGGSSYQWYKDGVPINGAKAATYTATAAGTYTADIISGDCKAQASNASVITTGASLVGTISPATVTICDNGAAILTASGGDSYQWYHNDVAINGATAATYRATEEGVYTADIMGGGGCKGKSSNKAIVTVTEKPSGTISPATVSICPGGEAKVTASGGASYQWYKDGVALPGATQSTYMIKEAGMYSADVINGACKGKAANSVVATISDKPTGTITPAIASLCGSNTVELTASGGVSYQWYKDGVAIRNATAVAYNVSSPGNYSVAIFNGNCSGTASNTVTVTTGAPITFKTTITGLGCTLTSGAIAINEVTGGSGTGYSYSVDNGITFQSGNTFAGLSPGQYQIVVKDEAGCKSAPVAATVNDAASILSAAVATTNISCTQNTGVATINVSGGQMPYTYSLNGTTAQSSNVFNNLSAGTHKVEVKDAGGCSTEVSFTIKRVDAAPQMVIHNPAPICPGTTANLKEGAITSGSDPDLVYTYWTNQGATSALNNPEAVQVGTYYIKGTNAAGCATVKPVVVSVMNTPAGAITPENPAVVCTGESVTLTATNGSLYQWYKDDVAISGATGNTYNVTQEGKYTVLINNGSCVVLAANSVVVKFQACVPADETKVFVPTAFTPNRNGENDLLQPHFMNVRRLVYFKVFNRWGQQVFQSNIIGQGWDGTLKGVPQPSETYSWILECVDFDGKTIKQSGRSLLIR